MFRNIRAQYTHLQPPVKSLISLYWVYDFSSTLIGVFLQLFLYQRFGSIFLNIVSTMLFYTGCMMGFCIAGHIASILKINIKHGFWLSFVVMSVSTLFLLFTAQMEAVYAIMALIGMGHGFFWLTVHTFELTETHDHERDLYSSIVSAGSQILMFAAPAVATFLLWVSGMLGWGTYTLLFIITPLSYLAGLFCFSNIKSYYPKQVVWADVQHFFSDRKNQLAQLYMFGSGVGDTFGLIIPPLAALFILGGALEVGVYKIFFGIFSALVLLIVAKWRTESNRLGIYAFTTILLVLVTVYFGYALTFTALVVYTIINGILTPLREVSSHVIALQTMESIGREGVDFYPTMIFRDALLWVARCVGCFVFLVAIYFFDTEQQFLALGLYLLALSHVVTYWGASLLLNNKTG